MAITPVKYSEPASGVNVAFKNDGAGNLTQAAYLCDPSNPDSAIVATGGRIPVEVGVALPAGTNNIGDVDVLSVPVDPFGANADAASATGSISAKLRFIAGTGIPLVGGVTTVATVTNISQFGGQAIAMGTGARSAGTLRVTIATDDVVPCSQSGTWNIGTVTTVTTVSTVTTLSQFGGNAINLGNGAVGTGTLRVTIASDSTGILAGVTTVTTLTGGGVAHDGVDSGNPVKIGTRSISALSGGTAVAAADRSDALSDLDGAIVFREDCPFGDYVSGNATNTDGSSTQCIGAQGSGIKTILTDITLCNTSSSDITVDIKDGTTVKWSFPVPQKGGVVFSWKRPLVGTANTAWNFDPSAAASTITCSMSGFKTKV